MQLPSPRGPISEQLFTLLRESPRGSEIAVPAAADPLRDEDLHVSLYAIYELSYRGITGVDDRWEWEPGIVGLRRALEARFEAALRARVDPPKASAGVDVADLLRGIDEADEAPSLSRFLQSVGDRQHFEEFLMHRSAYQLKEADPHSWAIPRLWGKPKAALLEIQFDEYGAGDAASIHAHLFACSMEALGLDPTYGAYIERLPAVTLATVNLMSMFGVNRRWRGALMGHLALFEMTSSAPNRRYAHGLRRLGLDEATPFFDEHVEADAVHEMVAVHDLAGGLVEQQPELFDDLLFGAQALADLEGDFARHVLDSWENGRSSLRAPSLTSA